MLKLHLRSSSISTSSHVMWSFFAFVLVTHILSNNGRSYPMLNECHPVQIAEFGVEREIDHEPAFNWWLKHVLKKRERTVASIGK